MLSTMRLLRTRLTGGAAAFAVFSLVLLGVAATEGQAAGDNQAHNGEGQSTTLRCDGAGYESKKFAVGDKNSQIREITICAKGNSSEAFAHAEHLAIALTRASNEYRGGSDLRSSALADSPESQARTPVNHSAPAGDRVGSPASSEELVKMLEDRLSVRPD